jgi:hypothetical protein
MRFFSFQFFLVTFCWGFSGKETRQRRTKNTKGIVLGSLSMSRFEVVGDEEEGRKKVGRTL